jgi:hypothetical protein
MIMKKAFVVILFMAGTVLAGLLHARAADNAPKAGVANVIPQQVTAAPQAPAHLLCERAENPVIDVAAPALSWKLADGRTGAAQTAYRILVASSPEQLASDNPLFPFPDRLSSVVSVQGEKANS